MPLLDHFNPPLNRTHAWRSFHLAWAAAIARLLNQGVLPSGYYAVPLIDRDGSIEIDVAALRYDEAAMPASGTAWSQSWVAPAPVLAVAVDLPEVDGVGVQVFADDGDPQLVAAVELLSPRNKDRPAARRAFGIKCVSYLQQGSSVVVAPRSGGQLPNHLCGPAHPSSGVNSVKSGQPINITHCQSTKRLSK
jgi:hypothetical protein